MSITCDKLAPLTPVGEGIPTVQIIPAAPDDTLKILKRVETRLCRLMASQGVAPNGTMLDQISARPAEGEANVIELELPSAHVSLADLSALMRRYHPDTEFDLFVGGARVASIRPLS